MALVLNIFRNFRGLNNNIYNDEMLRSNHKFISTKIGKDGVEVPIVNPDSEKIYDIDKDLVPSITSKTKSEIKTARSAFIRSKWNKDFPNLTEWDIEEIEEVCQRSQHLSSWFSATLSEYSMLGGAPIWAKGHLTKNQIEALSATSQNISDINREHAISSMKLASYKRGRQMLIDKTRDTKFAKLIENDKIKYIHSITVGMLPHEDILSCVHYAAKDYLKTQAQKEKEGKDYVSPSQYENFVLNKFKSKCYEECVINKEGNIKDFFSSYGLKVSMPMVVEADDHSSAIRAWEEKSATMISNGGLIITT